MENQIQEIAKTEVLGKDFRVYGSVENPLFLAKDVAEWIEHSDVHKMVQSVDEDEKVRNNVPTLGGIQESWFLTEDGLYEVLMQSRKPIAKQFKKEVKKVLHSLRVSGGYIRGQENMTPEQIMANAILLANNIISDLKNKLAETEKPLHLLTDGAGCYTMTQAAKALKLGYGGRLLIKNLRTRQVLNFDNTARQCYINSGYFKVVIKFINETVGNVPVTLVTGKGLLWLAKAFGTKVDESYIANVV